MAKYKGIAMDKSLDGLRMFQDNVLVLMDHIRDARKEETRGGIVLPQTAKKPGKAEAVLATVILAGPGAHITEFADHFGSKRAGSTVFHECPVKPGDRIVVDSAIAGQPITIDGLEHRIIRQHNVIGVVEDEEEVFERGETYQLAPGDPSRTGTTTIVSVTKDGEESAAE